MAGPWDTVERFVVKFCKGAGLRGVIRCSWEERCTWSTRRIVAILMSSRTEVSFAHTSRTIFNLVINYRRQCTDTSIFYVLDYSTSGLRVPSSA